MKGNAQNLTLKMRDRCELDASSFEVENAIVEAKDHGKVRINATQTVTADMRNKSDLELTGGATLIQNEK